MPTPARPWPRLFARFLDMLLFGIVFRLSLPFVAPSFSKMIEAEKSDAGLSVLIMLCWIPLEAICLAKEGTTPGKAILGIHVANQDGTEPTFRQAIMRSFLVWWGGLACGFPLIWLVTASRAYSKLKKTGSTFWDAQLKLSVSQEQISMTRQILFGALLLGLVVLIIIGSLENG